MSWGLRLVSLISIALMLPGCSDAPPAAKNDAKANPNQDSGVGRNTFVVKNDGAIDESFAKPEPKAGYVFNVLTAQNKAEKPGPDALNREPIVFEDADANLKQTIVTAYLQRSHRDGESLLWCATMQLAWNEYCDFLGGPIRIVNDPPVVNFMNKRLVSKDDLDDASYVAHGGVLQDVVPLVQEEWKRKFPNARDPKLLPENEPRDGDLIKLVMYAALLKKLEFKHPFTAFNTHLDFQHTHIQGFGLGSETPSKDWAEIAGQVTVWYASDTDFVVELQTKQREDQLYLARMNPGATLLESVQALLARVAQPPSPALTRDERLEIPAMNFELTKNYAELVGNRVLNIPYLNAITKAAQSIRLTFNEAGALLESFAVMETWVIANGEESPKPKTRKFIFDAPFLMVMKRADSKMPYLAFWVANPELLLPAKPPKK